MIYSEEIPKICSLCIFANKAPADAEFVFCRRENQNKGITESACRFYKYDILKRSVKRRKALKVDFSEEDFRL